MKYYWTDWKLLLFGIVLLGAIFRFYHLGENSFVADEFLDMNSAYGFFQTGQWQAWNFNVREVDTDNVNQLRDSRAWLYKWQVAELFSFLPPTEGVARAVSAFWGVLGVILVYFVAFYYTKRREIGLIAALLLALSVSALVIDRRLRMYAMFGPVFLAFSWMLFRFLEEPYLGKVRFIKNIWNRFGFNVRYLIPAGLLGLLSLHLHLLTVNIAFIVLVYALIMAWQRIHVKEYRNKYVFILACAVVGTVGMTIFAPHFMEPLTASLNFPDNHYEYISLVLRDYAHAMAAVVVLGFGVWYLVSRKEAKKEGLWISLSFLTLVFLSVFVWKRNVGEQYIFFAQPFKVIIMAAGIYAIARFFKRHLKGEFGRRAFGVPVTLMLLLLPHWGYFFQENNTYHQNSKSDNPNYRSIFAYFLKHRQPNDILITRELRNYYWSGANVPVENIGGEITKDKLTLERLQSILAQHPSGWVILSDNDDTFVSNDAMAFIEKNMERVNVIQVRGNAVVYRFGAK